MSASGPDGSPLDPSLMAWTTETEDNERAAAIDRRAGDMMDAHDDQWLEWLGDYAHMRLLSLLLLARPATADENREVDRARMNLRHAFATHIGNQ